MVVGSSPISSTKKNVKMDVKKLYTIKDFVALPEIEGTFNEGKIRWYITNNTDGFNNCVSRIGGQNGKWGRVLIDIEKFRKWINGEYKE